MADKKAKYWWAVLYPENMISSWQDDIADILQLPFAYCIHDKDLLSDGDEDRKVHVHLFIAFPNTTTYKHALSVFDLLSAEGKSALNTCKAVISCRRAFDYLIHDTDECRKKGKHQYQKEERITGNNFDIGAYEQLGLEEKQAIRRELSFVVIEKQIANYATFYSFVVSNYDSEYENVVVSYQGHFDKLCKGVYRQLKKYHQAEERERILETTSSGE